MRAFLLTTALFLSLSACSEEHVPAESTDGYDAFGEAITPVDAVPVHAAVADAEQMVGRTVKLEGTISEVCQGMGCWLTLQVVDGPVVRIDVPRDEAGEYVYTFPKDASGRRAVVAGVFTSGQPHHEEGQDTTGHHEESEETMAHHAGGDDDEADHHAGGDMDSHGDTPMEGHDERETEILNATTYSLTATGALLERVRA